LLRKEKSKLTKIRRQGGLRKRGVWGRLKAMKGYKKVAQKTETNS